MFTGLVRDIGIIDAVTKAPESLRVRVLAQWQATQRELGASVCVDGICLTVVASDQESMSFDVAFETLRCTAARRWAVGTRVNLEPSLCVGDALGGHFVTGHVDGLCRLLSVEQHDEAVEWWLAVPSQLACFVAAKGSIALAGVSLTVNVAKTVVSGAQDAGSIQVEAGDAHFMVGLVPHTLAHTTLSDRRPGDDLNVEVDLLARYVLRQQQHRAAVLQVAAAADRPRVQTVLLRSDAGAVPASPTPSATTQTPQALQDR